LAGQAGLRRLGCRGRRCHRHFSKVIDEHFHARRASHKYYCLFADLSQIETVDAVADFHAPGSLRRGLRPSGQTRRAVSILHDCVSARTQDCRAKQNQAADALR
jgi:hypothetical protein